MVAVNTMLDRFFYSDTAKELSNSEALLYILLLWLSQKQNPVEITYKEIREYAGISNVTITNGVRKMVKLGLVRKIYRFQGYAYEIKDARL